MRLTARRLAVGVFVFMSWMLSIASAQEPAKSAPVPAAESAGGAKPSAAKPADLSVEQAQIASKYRELEQLLIQMAELTAPTDPRRASLLRRAVAQSKERAIDDQFQSLITLLKEDRLANVVKGQGEVKDDLDKLLALLLSEDRSKRIESEKARIRDYIKQVNKLIKEQKGIQGQTQGEGDTEKLAGDQGKLGEKTGELAKKIEEAEGSGKPKEDGESSDKEGDSKDGKSADDKEGKPSDQKNDGKPSEGKPSEGKPSEGKPSEGKPSEGKPSEGNPSESKSSEGKSSESKPSEGKPSQGKPSEGKPSQGQPSQGEGQEGQESQPAQDSDQQQDQNPAQQRIAQAQKRMEEAKKKLEEAQRNEAADKQEEAIKELEKAVAELEEILRQLREEESARMLAALEARFRKMLEKQIQVYEGTKRIDSVPEGERDRDHEIEAGRLSRQEAELVGDADRALALLQDDGTAVVFPEAIRDMREDMEQVTVRLAQAKVNNITQGIEQDIIAALEEMIAALVKAQKDREKKPPQGGGGGGGGGGDPPLVDTIAELKMVRALQMRVNVRTQRYSEMIKTEQAEAPELLQALGRLAERELRIHKVTRDIVVGRNK